MSPGCFFGFFVLVGEEPGGRLLSFGVLGWRFF